MIQVFLTKRWDARHKSDAYKMNIFWNVFYFFVLKYQFWNCSGMNICILKYNNNQNSSIEKAQVRKFYSIKLSRLINCQDRNCRFSPDKTAVIRKLTNQNCNVGYTWGGFRASSAVEEQTFLGWSRSQFIDICTPSLPYEMILDILCYSFQSKQNSINNIQPWRDMC